MSIDRYLKIVRGAAGFIMAMTLCSRAQVTLIDNGSFRYERPHVNLQRSSDETVIHCADHISTARAGEVDLPSYHVNWAVGTDPVIHISNIEYDTIRTGLPVSRAVEDTSNIPELRSSRAGDEYRIASIVDSFVVRGVRGVTVRIDPFQQSSRSGEVISVKSCDITVESSPVPPVTIESPTFYNIMKKSFPNAESQIIRGIRAEKENYLIIAETGFHAALQQLIDYREQEYNVTLIDAVSLGGNQMLIINKIKELYADPATRPTYLLLVGGFPYLPMCNPTSTSSLGSPLNDLWYGAIDGDDHYADILVGRFSMNSGENEKLTNAITKTISYENAQNHPRKNLYIAAGGQFGEYATEPMKYVDTTYYVPNGYSSTHCYESEMEVTTEMVTEHINNGLDFLFYSGHGNWDHWKTGQYKSKHVADLTNESYPIVFSFACLTGDLSTVLGECFGETWVNEKGGAVAFLGATTETTWKPDDHFQRAVVDGIFDPTISTMQGAIAFGKMSLDASFPKYGVFYSETFNLCGDPALKVAIPNDNPVSTTPSVVSKNQTSFAVRSLSKGFEVANQTNDGFAIELFSMNGKRIMHVASDQKSASVSTNGIAPGIYTLQLSSHGISQKFTTKMIVK